jgi:hypothetical protein
MTSTVERSRPPRIGPAGRAALELLERCPRMPTDVLGVMLRHRQSVTTAQLLARLSRAGLVQYKKVSLGPLLGSRPVRVWTLTAAGDTVVSDQSRAVCRAVGGPLSVKPAPRREQIGQRSMPLLVGCYRLLAEVVRGLNGPVRVSAWEYPWIRRIAPRCLVDEHVDAAPSPGSARMRRVRLPAAVVLESSQPECRPLSFVLLPDLGTAPFASYRPALEALLHLRRAADAEHRDPALIVGVATSPRLETARVQKWHSFLRDVALRAAERPLPAQVVACTTRLRPDRDTGRIRRHQLDEVLALLARHPLLTPRQVASLVGTSTARISRLKAQLVERGWLRPLRVDEALPGMDAATLDRVQRLGLVELTAAGQREASRRLVVSTSLARRRHGVIADRRGFLRYLEHTVGANAFFVELAVAARRATICARDDALLEWRSAVACAYGRFRPDGYGCYRRGSYRFGFFLEYDRGTERRAQYAAKLDGYYRYRDSGKFRRDYTSFPTVLVVTTSEVAEDRFAREAYLAAERCGGAVLRIFLTTTGRISAHPDGALGPVWRTAVMDLGGAMAQRVHWLPQTGRSGGGSTAQQAESVYFTNCARR